MCEPLYSKGEWTQSAMQTTYTLVASVPNFRNVVRKTEFKSETGLVGSQLKIVNKFYQQNWYGQ